jgi:hypothetical protein
MESIAMPTSYILKWHEEDAAQHNWFIRGIKANRSFYGEVVEGEKKAFNVSGEISESDFSQLLDLAAAIEQEQHMVYAIMPWQGYLWKGPIASGSIIYTYPESADRRSSADLLFPRLIDILAPYVRKFY